MAALRALWAAALLAWPSCACADPADRWEGPIAEASLRFGISEEWIRGVMRIESGGRALLSGRPIVSRAGAIGLMQLMPGTWRAMRARVGLGADPHDPHDNILAGAAYLRMMYDRFGYPGLFAAYNAGPARYSAYLSTGRRLPRETRSYLEAVAGVTAAPPATTGRPAAIFAPAGFPLFPGGAAPANSTAAGGMFVALTADGHR